MPHTTRNHRTFSQVGEYAGRAVYRPRDRRDLKADLYPAIGQTVELEFAGVARAEERFAGQNLYRERGPGAWLPSSFVPEEDVEFLDRAPTL